jgi:2,3-dihydroxybenzoate-AMP ligase
MTALQTPTPVPPIDGVVPYPADVAARYRAAGHWTGATMDGLLRDAVRAAPGSVALVDRDRRWSYRDLDDRVERLAAGLVLDGLRPAERVVVQLPNIAEFVVVVFALFRIGAVPVFALPAHRRVEVEHFATVSEAVAIVTVDRHAGFDHAELARSIAATVASVRRVVIVPAGAATSTATPIDPSSAAVPGDPMRVLDQVTAAGPAPGVQVSPASVAFLQVSGGTTGTPKLIPRTHDDYLYSVRESARICELTADSVLLVALPAAHNFTMSSPGILGVLHAHGTIVMTMDPSPKGVLPLLAAHRVTIVPAVPPLVIGWLASPRLHTTDLSALRIIQVGGAKLSRSVAERIGPAFGCRLQQVFGMAEGLVNYTRAGDDHETVVGTQGRPISPDDEVLVVDDEDRPVPDGTAGHLLTRGPYTIRGYLRAPEHNASAFTADGFYRTGDIVVRRADGNLTVVGRGKDQINRGGEKVAPEEIENALLRHPGVHDVSVVGRPDEVLGERIHAYVVPLPATGDPAQGGRPRAVDLRRHLNGHGLAAYKMPDEFHLVDTLPETAVGKIDRVRLGGRRPSSRAPIDRSADQVPDRVGLVGVGFGPANMALAIALQEARDRGAAQVPRPMFFDAQAAVRWHHGMLLDDSHLQVSFLKDLVTFRNPLSPFTFVNFLAESGRLVDFTNRSQMAPLRVEFAAYLRWAADRLAGQVRYGHRVETLTPVLGPAGTLDGFDVVVSCDDGVRTLRTRDVVVAAGLQPRLPEGIVTGPRVWHSADHLDRVTDLPAGRSFVVVGSGQSAVEVALDLYDRFPAAAVHLVSSQFGIGPSDQGPLVNQIFDPASVDLIFDAPPEVRERLDRLHRNANNGVAHLDVINAFFDRQYRDQWLGRTRLHLHRMSRLAALSAGRTAPAAHGGAMTVTIGHDLDGSTTQLVADAVVLATGYRAFDVAPLLGDHAGILRRDEAGRPLVDRDCRAQLTGLQGTGRGDGALYLVGQSDHQHGISTTLLSNVAVRAGEITASLLDRHAAAVHPHRPQEIHV